MRLLVVSNRLPITVEKTRKGYRFHKSIGGLVSGLSSYLDSLGRSHFTTSEYLWVGWPGLNVDKKKQRKIKDELLSHHQALPVFLTENAMDKFYYGFCNKIIWPLFHYFPTYAIYEEAYWQQYQEVNRKFAQAVLEILTPGDIVWVQDYHLMLLPKLVREKKPATPIGFFLHIPFPSYEIYRLLPRKWGKAILEGLLGATLIGFHTHDYTQYFLRSVLRILGHEHNMGKLIVGDHLVRAQTFPMGVDINRFAQACLEPDVQKERKNLRNKFKGQKVIVSVDRLDYTKGIINRLHGYDIFLEKHPEWRGKVVLVLVVVPSRVGVEHYQQMKKKIDELVGRINGKYGSLDWVPAIYQYNFVPFKSLSALYSAGDVGLITPLRDGMNLIAKEFIACRVDQKGVLILSEMAGAAKELGEAIIINPSNREEIAEALKEALEMPEDRQIQANRLMQDRLRRYDVVRWASNFLKGLQAVEEEHSRFEARLLSLQAREDLLREFRHAQRRLLFFDYDGTLVPFADKPHLAKPGKELLERLEALTALPETDLVLISGRDHRTLEEWFGFLPVGMVAEHGGYLKLGPGQDWQPIKPLHQEWKDHVMPIMKVYVDRLPGSFIEEKDFSLVWHYRQADPEQGPVIAKEFMDDMFHFTANIDVQILQGHKVVEVRSSGIDKGRGGKYFAEQRDYDFILALGDDWTDEDLFKALPESAHTLRVGMVQSFAKFNLRDPREVNDLIDQLIKVGVDLKKTSVSGESH